MKLKEQPLINSKDHLLINADVNEIDQIKELLKYTVTLQEKYDLAININYHAF